MNPFYSKKYHGISEYVTNIVSFFLWIGPIGSIFFTAGTIYVLITDEFNGGILFLVLFSICVWVVYFIGRWQVYHTYFIYYFEEDELIIRLFNNKEFARYRKEDVKNLYFRDTVFRKLHCPHLIAEFKNGRKVKFDVEMAMYPALVDDMEQWSGITLPNKKERLKNRGDEPLNPYYR
jgi:hypothetical protein